MTIIALTNSLMEKKETKEERISVAKKASKEEKVLEEKISEMMDFEDKDPWAEKRGILRKLKI